MESEEFLKAYTANLEPSQIYGSASIPEVKRAQDYSYGYGQLLHACLRGDGEAAYSYLPALRAYEQNGDKFRDVENTLIDTPGGWQFRNEVSFLGLNQNMRGLWTPVLAGSWPSEDLRKRTVALAMDNLALEGFGYYEAREAFVKKQGGTHALFDISDETYSRYIGVVQEVDVALVLINFIKHNSNLTVVPAPLQFSGRSRNANSNFIVYDFVSGRTVGVQALTRAIQERVDNYDKTRVVVVDGTVDLGNVKAIRIKKNRSTEQVRAWPGIVAATLVGSIKTHGKNIYSQHPTTWNKINRAKMMAKQALGGLSADYNLISSRIGERILRKL